MAKSVIDAQKIYRLSNGKWTANVENLDIEIPEMKNWELSISPTSEYETADLYFSLTGKNLMNGCELSYRVNPNGQVLVTAGDAKPHIYPCKMEYMASRGGSPGCYL